MGEYTGLRFKGYVKEEFRREIDKINKTGAWYDSEIVDLFVFGYNEKCSFIPKGALINMPHSWQEDYINEKGEKELEYPNEPTCYWYKKIDVQEFKAQYAIETGYWQFQCSLKNQGKTIEAFFKLLALIVEKLDHLETYYNGDAYSKSYSIENGIVVLQNDKFKTY